MSPRRPGGRSGRAGRNQKKGRPRRRLFQKRKSCRFCHHKEMTLDYRDPRGLRYFITERGKIIPSRISGNCAKHQRTLAVAVKRARILALIPFTVAHSS